MADDTKGPEPRYSKAELVAAQARELAMSRNLYRRMIASGVSEKKAAELRAHYAQKLAIYTLIQQALKPGDWVAIDLRDVEAAFQTEGPQPEQQEVASAQAN